MSPDYASTFTSVPPQLRFHPDDRVLTSLFLIEIPSSWSAHNARTSVRLGDKGGAPPAPPSSPAPVRGPSHDRYPAPPRHAHDRISSPACPAGKRPRCQRPL